ncbi:hypothetical protein BTR14_13080 [Rhizobium rhizosphaerae]|uniref:Uncharacterized protein n=1 Tax=Xaviernesmea rhizosphaerae TaxID=1672749 RepID=A0ABX3PCS2_9HYPH|nr:hypothetical protein BTR14_13080 [Xaviernesmea rhizosphaerae]
MRPFKLALKIALTLIALILGGLVCLTVAVAWSSSVGERDNAECSMLIIEKKIEPLSTATEYRRACMAAKGYGMLPTCWAQNFSSGSCFVPAWMFWINKI